MKMLRAKDLLRCRVLRLLGHRAGVLGGREDASLGQGDIGESRGYLRPFSGLLTCRLLRVASAQTDVRIRLERPEELAIPLRLDHGGIPFARDDDHIRRT